MRGDAQKAHSFEEEVREPRAQHEMALRSETILAMREVLGEHQLARVQMQRQRANARLPHVHRTQSQRRQLLWRQLGHVRVLVVSCERYKEQYEERGALVQCLLCTYGATGSVVGRPI